MSTPASLLQVEIAEVGRLIYSGYCTKLVAPAALGEVCILPRHAPFLSKLRPGEVRLQTEAGEDQFFFLAGGYLEVKDNTASLLADSMQRSGEIDRQAALDARESAERVLRKSHLFKERDLAMLELAKALAQLQVLEHAELHRLKKPYR